MAHQNINEKKIILLVFFAGILIYGMYEYFQRKEIERQGIFTKATVINSEGYKGGLMITIRYKYLAINYEATIVADLGKSAIGSQYFIQFFPNDPKAVVFHKEKPVPDCLTNIEPPKAGWDKIPSCP